MKLFIQILFVFLGYSLNASAQVKTTDSTFIHDSRPIIPFVVGKKDIEAQDRKWILQTLIPKLQALGDSGIILGRASSSPEGSLYINTRLAQARKNSMNALLRSYGIQADRIRYDVAPMDFALLRTLLRLEHDAYYPTLDSLFNRYGNNVLQLKEAAIRQNQGKFWQHLYHNYFPRLRSVRIMAINKSLARTEKPQMDIMVSSIQSPILSLDSMMPKQEIIPLSSIAKTYRRELLSIKTNLLFDLAYMPGYNRFCPIPNIAIEYYPIHGHSPMAPVSTVPGGRTTMPTSISSCATTSCTPAIICAVATQLCDNRAKEPPSRAFTSVPTRTRTYIIYASVRNGVGKVKDGEPDWDSDMCCRSTGKSTGEWSSGFRLVTSIPDTILTSGAARWIPVPTSTAIIINGMVMPRISGSDNIPTPG